MSGARRKRVLKRKIQLIRSEIRRREVEKRRKKTRNDKIDTSKVPDKALKKCAQVLLNLSKLPEAVEFLEPVDWKAQGIPDYPKKIKRPMDLGTIRRKLKDGLYLDPKKFEADAYLVFSNCKKYNPLQGPGGVYYRKAVMMEKALRREYETLIGPLETETVHKFRKVLDVILNNHRSRNPFMEPVNTKHAYGYDKIVKHPMDVKTIRGKLHKYTSAVDFAKDLGQIWTNACLYNPIGHVIHTAADQFRRETEAALKVEFPQHFDPEVMANLDGLEIYEDGTVPIPEELQGELAECFGQLTEDKYAIATTAIQDDLKAQGNLCEGDEIDIDISDISAPGFVAILRFIRKSLAEQAEEREGGTKAMDVDEPAPKPASETEAAPKPEKVVVDVEPPPTDIWDIKTKQDAEADMAGLFGDDDDDDDDEPEESVVPPQELSSDPESDEGNPFVD